MKALVFSDLHGEPALIKKVKELSKNADLAICCGDITPVHGNTIETARRIGKLDIKLYIVPGNFELPKDLEIACKENDWINVHGIAVKIDNIIIAGCGGANKGPFNTPYELDEKEFKDILDGIDIKPTIFVSHTPPKGATDSVKNLSIGSEALRRFIESKSPVLNLCGHVHENGGKEARINNTKIMNIARQVKIIDI